MGKLFLFAALISVVGVAIWYSLPAMKTEPPPPLDPNEWWGPNDLKGKVDDSIRPFQVKFTEEMINDLKTRLRNKRQLAPPLEGVTFEYGFNSKLVDPWAKYWSEEYNFGEREKFFNQFPQYKTNIQGLDIHFIWVKPQVKPGVTVVPILLMHGFPGSVREFYEAIPFLTKQSSGYDFVFEVVVPSLVGYGFSDAAVRPGLGPPQMGVIFKNLMNRLGHKKFYIQGGDWGAIIGYSMVTYFQEEVLGFHSNMLVLLSGVSNLKIIAGSLFPPLIVNSHQAHRIYPLSNLFANIIEDLAFHHFQSTKPDTIGVALSDSPAGFLSYVLEKFPTWTCPERRSSPDGGITCRFSKDQLLDNLMMYWASNSITTSVRLYSEAMSRKVRGLAIDDYTTKVPTWALQTKHEIFYQPANIYKIKYLNLLGVTELDDGGHFIAFELPQVFSQDVFKAVKAFREFHKNKTE